MSDWIAMAGWLTFLLSVVGFHLFSRRPRFKRLAAQLVITVVVVMSFLAGFSRRSLWPFSSWPMFTYTLGDTVTARTILAIDEDGAAHRIDARVWAPLSLEELLAWHGQDFPQLDTAQRDLAAAYLLRRVNEARDVLLRGERLRASGMLGNAGAPTHFLHPHIWNTGSTMPREPFVAIRFVVETWNVDSGRADPAMVQTNVMFEYPRAP